MSDDDLLDLLERAALEELTPEQCDRLGAAAATSPEILAACRERIGLEERLAATLGRPRISIDELLAGRRRFAGSRATGRWLAPLLLGLLVAAVAAAVAVRPPEPRERVVAMVEPADTVDGGGEVDGEAGRPPVEAEHSVGTAVGFPDEPDEPEEKAAPDGASQDSPLADEDPDTDTTSGQAQPALPDSAASAPWAAALAVDAPDPTPADLFRPLPLRQRISQEELLSWFAPVPGAEPRFGTRRVSMDTTLALVDGRVRLRPPLREGTALRLLVNDPHALRIEAWSGNAGASIQNEGPAGAKRWRGDVLSRSAAGKPHDARWLASTSDARGHRSGAGLGGDSGGFTGILEVRYTEGALLLSRGEVRLVEVPLPAPPDEVFFDGTLAIGGIELVRSVPPPPLPEPPAASATWRPADLTWEGTAAATIEKRADGSVRLTQVEAAPRSPLVFTWKLPPPELGPREILVRLDDFTPGTGIVLDDDAGRQLVCGFLTPASGSPADRRSQVLHAWPPDQSPLSGGDPTFGGPAPRPVWLRFVAADSVLIVSWSGDGRRWARLRQFPELWTSAGDGAIARVGLFVGAHPGQSITLGELGVAELPGLARVLPRELREAVDPALVVETDPERFDAWVETVASRKPADVDEDRWLAAAAIRSLALQRTNLTRGLCQLVWKHARSLALPLEDRLAVCDDINRLIPSLSQLDGPLSGLYGVVSRACADQGDLAGFHRAWLRLQQAPGDFSALGPFARQVDPLGVRGRLVQRLSVTGPAAARDAELVRRAFYDNDAGATTATVARPESGSPLVIPTQNELDNVAIAFDAAVGAGQWSDAQRAIAGFATAAPRDVLHSLVTDPRDRERLTRLPLLMADALAEAGFRDFMLREHAERGRLRVMQLRTEGDATGMAAAAVAFQGTPAAAEACEWLASRALAAGVVAEAREQADAGLAWAAPATRERLLAVRAIAEALAGGPVTPFPETTGWDDVPAAELATVVAAATTISSAPPAEPVPPTPLDAVKRLDLCPPDPTNGSGSRGDPRAELVPGSPTTLPVGDRIDWAAEACSFTVAPGRLLVNNRVELVAVDPATGGEQWRTQAAGKPGGVTSRSLGPMRATCDQEHAYVRRVAGGAPPTLAAVRLADGTTAWETPAAKNAAFVSDPVLLGDALWVCEVAPGQIQEELSLVAFDPKTGSRLRQRVIGGLTSGWYAVSPGRSDRFRAEGDCQVTVADHRLFVTAAGNVMACDSDGRILWLRRQPWLDPQADGWWWSQAQTPPLVHAGTLFVVQPGVQAVTAIDPRSGRLAWRVPLPGARRLIGLAGEGPAARLVVETAEGILAVEPRTGKHRMLLDAGDDTGDGWLGIGPSRLTVAMLAAPDGHAIVAVQRRRPGAGKADGARVALVWVDVVSGAVVRTAELPALAGDPPWAGPLTSAGGSLWLLSRTNPAGLHGSLWQLLPKASP